MLKDTGPMICREEKPEFYSHIPDREKLERKSDIFSNIIYHFQMAGSFDLSMRLREDINLDSLDFEVLLMELELHYNIDFIPERIDQFKTIGDLVNYLYNILYEEEHKEPKELFSDAEKGDRVWSDRLGYGTVNFVDVDDGQLMVEFPGIAYVPFFLDGRRHKEDVTNELHWDEIEYIEPMKVPELG